MTGGRRPAEASTPAVPSSVASGHDLHRRAGTAAAGPWSVAIGPDEAGWSFAGLRVVELAPGGRVDVETGPDEVLVLPLAGSCEVTCNGDRLGLEGRRDVFAGPTDFAYLPPGAAASVASADGGRFALPAARAARRLPFRYGPRSGVPVELRGAGPASRQVNNFATPAAFEADRLIACEVLTPGGNWSSYPPHKHDEAASDESELEEIYYYEIRPAGKASGGDAGPGAGGEAGGIAYQRVYGTLERPIDLLAEVRSGDVVLIPHGWHGPSMAAPGYDLYYLNVMAGPGAERAWRITDDPAHGWVRATWTDEAVDPRLPFPPERGRKR